MCVMRSAAIDNGSHGITTYLIVAHRKHRSQAPEPKPLKPGFQAANPPSDKAHKRHSHQSTKSSSDQAYERPTFKQSRLAIGSSARALLMFTNCRSSNRLLVHS